jgi:hypothetical protein
MAENPPSANVTTEMISDDPLQTDVGFTSSAEDVDLGGAPQWLVKAWTRVEKTTDDHALEMEVLQMDLAALRRCLQQKDDKIHQLMAEALHGQVAALAIRRDVQAASSAPSCDSFVQSRSTESPAKSLESLTSSWTSWGSWMVSLATRVLMWTPVRTWMLSH